MLKDYYNGLTLTELSLKYRQKYNRIKDLLTIKHEIDISSEQDDYKILDLSKRIVFDKKEYLLTVRRILSNPKSPIRYVRGTPESIYPPILNEIPVNVIKHVKTYYDDLQSIKTKTVNKKSMQYIAKKFDMSIEMLKRIIFNDYVFEENLK